MAATLESVPTAPGRLPALGHFGPLVLRRLRFVRSLRRHGDVVRVYFGDRPVYVVTSLALIRELLVERGGDFDKGSIFDQGKAFLGEGLITSAGELHRRQRLLIQPEFQRARIEQYVPVMRETALRVTGEWRAGHPVEVDEAMLRVAFGVVTGVMFSGCLSPGAEDPLLRQMRLLIQGALLRAFAPAFVRHLPIQRRYDRAVAEVRAITERLLDQCAAAPVRREDPIHRLHTVRGPGAENGMSPAQLRDELISIVIAGTETTGGALAWVLYELARRPEIAARVRDEVDRVVGAERVTAAQVDELTYTHRVLCEVLRRRATWLSTRRALHAVHLGGMPVPAGTEFAFSLYALHHDPDLYPRPDEFDVDRWLPEVARTRPRGAFMPFLEGNRKCLGHSFAWTELVVVVATLVARWRFVPGPGRVREVAVSTIRPSRMTLVPVAQPARSAGHQGVQEVGL
jgi:cytochrome P450